MPDVFIEHDSSQKHTHKVIEKKLEEKEEKPRELKQAKSRFSHKLKLFSSFVRDPMGVALAEQHDDEHILVFIRRAFITNIGWVTSTLILFLIPLFFPLFIAPYSVMAETVGLGALIVMLLFYYIVVLGFALANFLTWFYDIGIVTEKRAVDIDFYNISFVSVATARAQDLKDVKYAQKGFFESFFDYGDVTLVVEASGETLVFEKTPRPAEVVSILSALIGGHQ